MSLALVFEQYGDGAGNKGVLRYALSPDAIHVQFHDDRIYVYSNEKPGTQHVEAMKQLARQGTGLSTYISQRVQDRYERWYRITSTPSS
jgi:hypothetical protein